MLRKLFYLYKRKPSGIYYYRYFKNDGKLSTPKTTGRKKRTDAERFVYSIMGTSERIDERERILKLAKEYRYKKEKTDEEHINNEVIINWANIIWPELDNRERIAVLFVLFRGICFYCKCKTHLKGRMGDSNSRATIDHYIPLISGGSDNLNNIVLSCSSCNVKKREMNAEDFVKKLKET